MDDKIQVNGTEVPQTILIGFEQGKWPLKIWPHSGDEGLALEWLADGGNAIGNRRVFRFRLEPVCEILRVPPVEARAEEVPVFLQNGSLGSA